MASHEGSYITAGKKDEDDINKEQKQEVEKLSNPEGKERSGDRGEETKEGKKEVEKENYPEEESQLDDDDDEEVTTEDLLDQETLQDLLRKLGLSTKEKREKVLSEFTIKGIADYIESGKAKNIIVMTGAGLSTAAGIPDFRSPGTGLYSRLQEYNLPYPESIFTLDYFKHHPEPFYHLAKELYPGNFKPTLSHYFIKLLEQKGLLLRNYTQNIDGLETMTGLSKEKVVAAHGNFHTSHCISCRKEYTEQWVKEKIFEDVIPTCSECNGLVKPDIVFFGEALPARFFECVMSDFSQADLLVVMGTALKVQPFASLIDRVGKDVPRLLINKEKCGEMMFMGGFDFHSEYKYRDVAVLETCDSGCEKLVELLGWKDDLKTIMDNEIS